MVHLMIHLAIPITMHKRVHLRLHLRVHLRLRLVIPVVALLYKISMLVQKNAQNDSIKCELGERLVVLLKKKTAGCFRNNYSRFIKMNVSPTRSIHS